jgi:hypothetical protein
MFNDLKGIKELNSVINDFLSEFNVTADISDEFCYWTESESISYTLIMPERGKNYFMSNFNRMAPDLVCDEFLASLLHEVGHHMTGDLFDESDEYYSYDVRDSIAKCLETEPTEEVIADLYRQYFELPDEYEATAWAIEYMRENSEKVAEFWNRCHKAIMKFYFVNAVEVK